MWLSAVSIKKKKNLFYCKMCFLFILLVWALKTVLVAVGLAQHIRVSHFLLNSKCTFVALKQRMVTLVSISTAPTAHTRAKALGGNQEGIRCWKVLPLLPSSTFCSCFFILFRKMGNSDLRTLLSALCQRTTVCCFYLILIFIFW